MEKYFRLLYHFMNEIRSQTLEIFLVIANFDKYYLLKQQDCKDLKNPSVLLSLKNTPEANSIYPT